MLLIISQKGAPGDSKNFTIFFTVFIFIILMTRISFADRLGDEVKHNILILLETKSCVNCNLEGANLNRADLNNANLSAAKLKNATFFLASLSGVNFQNSDLRSVAFGGSDISNADFRGANISSTSFSGTYKRGALFGEKQHEKNPFSADAEEMNTYNTANDRIDHKDSPPLSTAQPDTINSRELPPMHSNAPPLKKVKPISKAIFISREIQEDEELQK